MADEDLKEDVEDIDDTPEEQLEEDEIMEDIVSPTKDDSDGEFDEDDIDSAFE